MCFQVYWPRLDSNYASIKNSSQYCGALWRTYEEVTSLKDRFPDFKVGHIGRSSNTVAHQHSFLARTQGINDAWAGLVPECLYDLLVSDSVNAGIME
jgi:hypothetical protein